MSSRADPFTSKLGEIMIARQKKISGQRNSKLISDYRKLVIANSHLQFSDDLCKLIEKSGMPTNLFQSVNDSDHNMTLLADADALRLLGVTGNVDNGASRQSTVTDTYARLCATRTPPAKKTGPARAGAKKAKQLERLHSAGPILDPEEATAFRALFARANYLAQDRPDIAFATKELCRDFAQPTRTSYEKLKRVGRYLAGTHRLAYQYEWETKVPEHIDVFVDTDFAGCKNTRRSTSGGVAMMGGHCAKHWAKTQTTVSLSSGESELHGICAGVAQAIGLQSICRDLGSEYKLRVHTDATAAIGIARRRGMGKIRHLDCADLWVQEKVRTGAIELLKVLRTENPADAFTKYVDKAILNSALQKIGMVKLSGRPKCAPDTLGLQP